MNDVEQDLRELFDRKASSVGGVAPKLPEQVRNRSRRRQVGIALVGGLAALAVLAGSAGVLRAVDAGRGRQPTPADDPWVGYEVFERTAVVQGFTITSPSDWYMVDQWSWARPIAADVPRDVRTTPVLMLSNTDRGLTTSPCFDAAFAVGSEEAIMTIAADDAYVWKHQGQADALPQAPTRFDSEAPEGTGVCGTGIYVPFATEDLPFVAHFLFGEDVSEEDRTILIRAFETMGAQATVDPTPIGARRDHPSGAYVIAGGENAAGPWTLELRPQTEPAYVANVQLELSPTEGSGVVAGGPFTVRDGRPIEQGGGNPVFGAVVKAADAVELRLEEGTPPIPAQVVPLPPSMPFDFDLFFASNDADVQATAVALDADGVPIAPSTPVTEELSHTTFLDEVDHLPPGQRWAPDVTQEGNRVVMPITFPDGATAELVYPTELRLEGLNVYPDTYGVLDENSSSCGWPVHASRHDPRGGWLRGNQPIGGLEGRIGYVELWEGTQSNEPYNFLIGRSGSWNIIVPCRSAALAGDTASWAELISAAESRDGLLVFEDAPRLDMHLPEEGATIRFSGDDVIVDVSSGSARCDAGHPDMGARDGVVQWCVEPSGGVYVYANAFEPRREDFLQGLASGLEIRNYRPGEN